jgi:hypothetical protein
MVRSRKKAVTGRALRYDNYSTIGGRRAMKSFNTFFPMCLYLSSLEEIDFQQDTPLREEPFKREAFSLPLHDIPRHYAQKQWLEPLPYRKDQIEQRVHDWYNACLFFSSTQPYVDTGNGFGPTTRDVFLASINRVGKERPTVRKHLMEKVAWVWLNNEKGMQEMIEVVAMAFDINNLIYLLAEVAQMAREADLIVQPVEQVAESKRKQCLELAFAFQALLNDEAEARLFFRKFIDIALLGADASYLNKLDTLVQAQIKNHSARSLAIGDEWANYRNENPYAQEECNYEDVERVMLALQQWRPISFSLTGLDGQNKHIS